MSNTMSQILPDSPGIDILSLSQIFNHTTNSYKLIFFRSLMSVLETDSKAEIDVQAVVNHMLTHAWFPSVYFKLNLGSQDMIFNTLTSLKLTQVDIADSKGSPHQQVFEAVTKSTTSKSNNLMLQYAPYRLLQPFFHDKLKGKPDHKKNSITADLSIKEFETIKPLYKIEKSEIKGLIKITLHSDWFEYLTKNLIVIKSWAELNWLKYLQSRNPNSPAISNKLGLSSQRESLTKQRKFWDLFLQHEELNCIFSNIPIIDKNYELDHFIPWTYVAHNQYWNLLPIQASVNASKSNNLPSERAIKKYIEVQYKAIKFAITNKKAKIIDDYILVLQCSVNDLSDQIFFEQRFTSILKSLIDSAANQGFQKDWYLTSSSKPTDNRTV